MAGAGDPVLLGGYVAKWCPVRIHNDVWPVVPTREEEPSAEEKAASEAGMAFEAEIFEALLGPRGVLRRPHAGQVRLAEPEWLASAMPGDEKVSLPVLECVPRWLIVRGLEGATGLPGWSYAGKLKARAPIERSPCVDRGIQGMMKVTASRMLKRQ